MLQTETFKHSFSPKKIEVPIEYSRIQADLHRYRALATDLGAAYSDIVFSKDIPVDERVRAKCLYPKCAFYGNNLNCPPHAPDLEFTRRLIARYSCGILFCVKGDPAEFTGPDLLKRVGRENTAKKTLNTICSEIESSAFYDGYYFALALGQGPCKSFWCADQPCAGLLPGGTCRFPLKSRSSLEAVGIDAFKLATERSWEMYPCGSRIQIDALPHVLLIGLILVT